MASPQSFIFAVYDGTTGAPKTGYAASLTFSTYEDETGAALAQPTISEVGGGLYKFTPTFTSGHVVLFILNTNGQSPNYLSSWLRPEDYSAGTSGSPQIVVFPVYDATTGAPKTGVVPTFSTYEDDLGDTLTQPSIVEVGGGMYKFAPVFPPNRSIAYVISTGQMPPGVSGFIRPEDFLSSGFIATAASASQRQVTVSFVGGYTLDAPSGAAAVPANWVISGPTGVTVTNVQVVNNQVVLTTTDQLNGGAYTLTIPNGVTANSGTVALLGPASIGFTGFSGDPALIQATPIDEHTVDLTFAFAPTAARALDPAQYNVSPALVIESIVQLSPTVYQMTLSSMAIGTSYTVTWPLH